jgi:exosortase
MERIISGPILPRYSVIWLFLAAFSLGAWPTFLSLGERWLKFDESYSHGFLVLFISLYLCAGTWKRIKPVPGFYWPWLIPLVISALIYMAGDVLLIEAFQQFALVPLILSGLMALLGWQQALHFVVPVGLLVFALPFWDYLSWSLQVMTVAVNQFMLSWFEIEFIVEGVFVYFPGVGAFEIAEGCSGLRYFLVGVTLALFYGELNLQKWRSRIWLVVAGILGALLANWLRVFIIIYVGYESDMTSSLVREHDFFGWWVFGATLIPLYLFGRWLEKKELMAPGTSGPFKKTEYDSRYSLIGPFLVSLPVLALAGMTWFGVTSESRNVTMADSGARQPDAALVSADEWLPLFDRRLAGWRPKMVGPDRVMENTYLKRGALNSEGGSDEILFVGLYSYDFQRPGGEVVHYSNRLYDSSGQLPERTFDVGSDVGKSLSGLTLRYRQSDELIHLAYGYYVEGRWERTELQAKLAQLPGIFNSRTDASLLVIGLQCDDCDGRDVLLELAPDIKKAAQRYLNQLYSGRE